MSYETIVYELEGDIATITINRPKSLNALNSLVLQELNQALDQIAENHDIRVLILTGTGEKAFVAGADIGELSTLNPLQARYFAKNGHAVMNKLQELSIPVIAAVNGFALEEALKSRCPVTLSMLLKMQKSAFRKSTWASFPVLAEPSALRASSAKTWPKK